MKKIFSFIAGVVAAMSLQAASYTEAVQITMTCAGGPEEQDVILYVDPAQASVATVANMATTYEDGQVNFYVADGANKYSEYKANAISNLPLAIVTNRRDVSYTFTFNAPIATEGLVLTDLRSIDGIKNIAMTNGDSYTFSVADEAAYAANTNVTIADRFIINYDPSALKYDVTLNGQYLATFSAPENVIIPTGLNAYTAEFQGEQSLLLVHKIEGNYIPANTGVILFNPEGGKTSTQYDFSLVKYAGNVDPIQGTNELKPSSAWVYPFEGTVYVLHDSEMWLYNGANMKPNKAFLHVQVGSGAPQRIRMVFSEEQGIESIAADEGKAVKFVENGRVFIKRGEKVYNLQGQLVK